MNFKLSGVQQTINKLAKVESELTKEVDAILEQSARDIAGQAKINAPVYLGELQNSIQPINIGKLRYEVGANAYHAPYVEFGTGPKTKVPDELKDIAQAVKGRSKRGNFKDFVRAMLIWGKKKGYFDTESAAYFAALKIYLQGQAPRPFLYPAFLKFRKQIVNDIRQVTDEKSG